MVSVLGLIRTERAAKVADERDELSIGHGDRGHSIFAALEERAQFAVALLSHFIVDRGADPCAPAPVRAVTSAAESLVHSGSLSECRSRRLLRCLVVVEFYANRL